MAFHFTAHYIGSDPLNIGEQLERFANEQWLPEHANTEEAMGIVLDYFKRTLTKGPGIGQLLYLWLNCAAFL